MTTPRLNRLLIATIAAIAPAVATSAQQYNFSALTQAAADAVAGRNVPTPVPGFELLILKDGRAVYDRAFGSWSIGRVGNADSATKTLSGALVMSLVDSSPIPFSLDSRLSDFMPAFNGEMQPITIRQCFSHTAGFGDSAAVGSNNLTLRQVALVISAGTLAFPPGSTFSYGGVSMQAAGAVAEIAGGAPWDTLFDQRIAGPLHMTATRYVLSTPANPRIAGGCESNAVEFSRFMEMLRSGGVYRGTRLLSQASVNQMFTRQTAIDIPIANTPLDGSADYGVGVWLDERDAQGLLISAQAAGARGFSSWIDFGDGVTGVFATDLTQGQNIRDLINVFRHLTRDAIAHPFPCNADMHADSVIDSRDFFDFMVAFFTGAQTSDFNNDDVLNSQDFFDFLNAFFVGC